MDPVLIVMAFVAAFGAAFGAVGLFFARRWSQEYEQNLRAQAEWDRTHPAE